MPLADKRNKIKAYVQIQFSTKKNQQKNLEQTFRLQQAFPFYFFPYRKRNSFYKRPQYFL